MRSFERTQPPGRRDPGDTCERIAQLALLRRQLGCGREMLKCAPAADSEMRATGHHPFRRSLEHLEELPFIVLAVPARTAKAYELPRERPGYEYRLAAVYDSFAFVCEARHTCRLNGVRRRSAALGTWGGVQAEPPCQACRNCARWGSVAELRQLRTRASSSSCCSRVS